VRAAQTHFDQLSPADFVAQLGSIFEHSPWVAEGVVGQRPFGTVAALHAAMCRVVQDAGEAAQLGLIRAHPELAGKAAIRGELTLSSSKEQHAAGLDQCSPEEYAELTALNRAYGERHGFPFILAVKGHTRQSVIAAMRERLGNPRETEIETCLAQIERIARFRLEAMFGQE
jgi:2-oxo-4-hydroxy-4-carboxy-5-ureidoimidazoline decarboxylase